MPELFKDALRKWRGNRMQKEAAFILGVPVATLRNGIRKTDPKASGEVRNRKENEC